MTVGSRKILSMVAEITRGVPKSDSHYVTDAETSREWDQLAASHERLKADHPGVGVAIPNDPDY